VTFFLRHSVYQYRLAGHKVKKPTSPKFIELVQNVCIVHIATAIVLPKIGLKHTLCSVCGFVFTQLQASCRWLSLRTVMSSMVLSYANLISNDI